MPRVNSADLRDDIGGTGLPQTRLGTLVFWLSLHLVPR